MAVPEDVVEKIFRRLFQDADAVGWTNLADKQRSKHYEQWVESPEVGQVLLKYIAQDRVRVWIKDRVMKEYTRARYGVGKYSGFVAQTNLDPSELLSRALGPSWEQEGDKIEIKPFRVAAVSGDRRVRFCWGAGKDFKHLVWAALEGRAVSDEEWVLCVVGSFEKPTTVEEKRKNERIGELCGLLVKHV